MQILLSMSPQYGQTLCHIIALEGKGRGLDFRFVLLQMPKRWDTQFELPFRNTWGSKTGPSSPHLKWRVLSPKASGLQSHQCVEGSGSLLVHTCSDMVAMETHTLHGCAHSVWVFCCGLLSGGILPIFDEICVLPFSMLPHSLGPPCAQVCTF